MVGQLSQDMLCTKTKFWPVRVTLASELCRTRLVYMYSVWHRGTSSALGPSSLQHHFLFALLPNA